MQSDILKRFVAFSLLGGFILMSSPVELEKSKWASLYAWIGDLTDTQEEENSTLNQVQIASWNDFHSSHTAEKVVLGQEQINKLSSTFAVEYLHKVNTISSHSIKKIKVLSIVIPTLKPFLSGIVIGAP